MLVVVVEIFNVVLVLYYLINEPTKIQFFSLGKKVTIQNKLPSPPFIFNSKVD
jgi:hypothetical protein